jgi:hypothetical protein
LCKYYSFLPAYRTSFFVILKLVHIQPSQVRSHSHRLLVYFIEKAVHFLNMATPLTLLAFDLLTEAGRKNPVIRTEVILSWSIQTKSFGRAPFNKKLFLWYFHAIFVSFIGFGVCSILLLARELLFTSELPQLPIHHLIITGGVALLTMYCSGLTATTIYYVNESVRFLNTVSKFEKYVKNQYQCKPKHQQHLKMKLRKSKAALLEEKIGTVSLVVTLFVVLIPYLFSIPFYSAKLDPVYYLLVRIFPSLESSYVFSIVRFYIIFEGLLEMSRVLMLLILVGVHTVQTLSSCLSHLDESNKYNPKLRELSPDILISNFQLLKVIISIFRDEMEVLAFVAVFFGAFSIILFLYLTFTVYPLVSILIYLAFPFGTAGFIICVGVLLPAVIQIHERSKNILKKARYNVVSSSVSRIRREYFYRKLNAIQPLYFYVGMNNHRLFYFQNSTKSTYIYMIVCKAIDLLRSEKLLYGNAISSVLRPPSSVLRPPHSYE